MKRGGGGGGGDATVGSGVQVGPKLGQTGQRRDASCPWLLSLRCHRVFWQQGGAPPVQRAPRETGYSLSSHTDHLKEPYALYPALILMYLTFNDSAGCLWVLQKRIRSGPRADIYADTRRMVPAIIENHWVFPSGGGEGRGNMMDLLVSLASCLFDGPFKGQGWQNKTNRSGEKPSVLRFNSPFTTEISAIGKL